jgi:predicted MPP superfamily phosphohydrolase
MKLSKKFLALTTAILMLSSLIFISPAFADSTVTLPKATFDESNVAIKFAALSDTHIQGTDALPSKKLTSALNQVNTKAGGNLDAIMITGDLTDYGLPEQVTELKRVFDNSKVNLNVTNFIFALGNHEYYNSQLKNAVWNGGYLFKDVFGSQAYKGATDTEIKSGDHHTVINGYHFITVNCAQYDGGVQYLASDIAWLRTQLIAAEADDPGKPIFVGSHPNITGTNLGSNEGAYWNGTDLYAVLKDYPQSIYFCGHLHFPENDERSIWQGDFTTVGLGSVYYGSVQATDENGSPYLDITSGNQTTNSMQVSQGLYIEVDKNNNVEITRMDFTNKKDIKTPWIIPSPKADKSQLLYYTPQQEAMNNTAPSFPAGATIKETSKEFGKYGLEFTQANDNDLVFCYQVSFIDKGTEKVIKQVSTYSDFYYTANPSDMSSTIQKTIYDANTVLAPFSLTYDKAYYIKIVALDSFGLKSVPLISNVIGGTSSNNSTTISSSSSTNSSSEITNQFGTTSTITNNTIHSEQTSNPTTGNVAPIVFLGILLTASSTFIILKSIQKKATK